MTEFRAIDPATGRPLGDRPEANVADLEAALNTADLAFARWSRVPLPDRAAGLRRLAAALRARIEPDAALMAQEMGKPVTQGRAEIEKCAKGLEVAADRATEWLAPDPVQTEASRCYVRHEPLGPILAIMPWNFPYWQLFRFAASGLAAGNPVILKHAPNVPGCADAIAEIFAEAGLPDLLVNVRARVDQIEALIADRRVAGVTLTGSTRAGKAVAAICGKYLKPSVLELGGSDPFVVLEDADLDAAAEIGARARLQNNGQSCIASKRFIVVESVAAAFAERMAARIGAARVGDPADPATDVGPLAREDLRDELARQVRESVAKGARVAVGGEIPARDGWWYPPTLLTGCGPGMPVWDEETFGPAAAIRTVPDADAAIAAANASIYGLGATVFTRDADRGAAVAARLEAGAVFVNDMVRSDPRFPFGGVKESGWGRELGREGMRAFTVTKTVWIR